MTGPGGQAQDASRPSAFVLTTAALGIVFGDIGTSPLYTVKTALSLVGGKAGPDAALGLLSLIVWTLILVTTLKYVVVALRFDHDGEGGILALMSLVMRNGPGRRLVVVAGLFGAALVYGDGSVTPAISVLSALEGLDLATPAVSPYVVPLAAVILLALFAVQPFGTARIGKAFGPLMALWFAALAILGIGGIAQNPAVLHALDPRYGLALLAHGGVGGFAILSGVFLCATGAEALYADLGHFGVPPIRRAWLALVLPSLLLNYAGQTALVMGGNATAGNVFYRLCPQVLLVPLIVLATLATIIASQAIITGTFSMTKQAMQLGYLPRLLVTQTSEEGHGQVYVGAVNWLLMIVTVALTLSFRKSDNLAAAYGIAVSLTMLMTTFLLYAAMRRVWRWGPLVAGTVAAGFFVIDVSFVAANLGKVLDGGYVPLAVAAVVCLVMATWRRGTEVVLSEMQDRLEALPDFLKRVESEAIARVAGTAVFLTRTPEGVPPVLSWHVRHNRSLHAHVFILTIAPQTVPRVPDDERLTLHAVAPDVWRGEARFGYMERPDIPSLMAAVAKGGCTLAFEDVTYYIGHETVIARDTPTGLPRWQEPIFAAMARNAASGIDSLRLPDDQTVEIGRRVAV